MYDNFSGIKYGVNPTVVISIVSVMMMRLPGEKKVPLSMFLFFSFLDSHTNVIWAYVTISICPAAQSFEAKTLILAYSEWLSEYDLSYAAW